MEEEREICHGQCCSGGYYLILRSNIALSALYSFKNGRAQKEVKSADESISEYYIRLNVKDQPGILGEIAAVMGRHNVSIVSVTQDIKDEDNVSLVFITHEALGKNVAESIKKIACGQSQQVGELDKN